MRFTLVRNRPGPAALVAAAALALSAAGGERAASAADVSHHDHAGADQLRIVKVVETPRSFVGNLAYDRKSGRLWLTAFGPPANTRGPSRLYEVDPSTGRVLSEKVMPFLGEFGGAAPEGGWLFQAIPHERALYRVSVAEASFGEIGGKVTLPGFEELPARDGDVYRFPFVAFTGVVPIDGNKLILYAADLGELVTVERDSGRVLGRVRTSKGLAGLTDVSGPDGRTLLVATFDPVDSAFKQESRRFMFRATHGILPLETVRAEGNYGNPGQKTVTWVLIDAESGEVLGTTTLESNRLSVGSVAVLRREPVPNAPYGRLVALTLGDEGIFTVEWTPR